MLGKMINNFKCLFLNLFIVCIIVIYIMCVHYIKFGFITNKSIFYLFYRSIIRFFAMILVYKFCLIFHTWFKKKKIQSTDWLNERGDAFRKVKIPPVHTSLHCVRFWHLLVKEKEGSQTQFTCFQAVIQIFIFSVVFINSNSSTKTRWLVPDSSSAIFFHLAIYSVLAGPPSHSFM